MKRQETLRPGVQRLERSPRASSKDQERSNRKAKQILRPSINGTEYADIKDSCYAKRPEIHIDGNVHVRRFFVVAQVSQLSSIRTCLKQERIDSVSLNSF